MSKQRPWRKFYPADWLGDYLLSQCSLGAHGLWIKMCCIAWTSHREGVLCAPDGRPLLASDLAKICRETPAQVQRLLDELQVCQVLSVDEDGCYYSRRIVRDAAQRAIGEEYGKRGGNPTLIPNRHDGIRGGDKGRDKATLNLEAEAEAEAEKEAEANPGFDTFWSAWPKHRRKTGKRLCLARWRSKGLESEAERVMAALSACKAGEDWRKNNGEFIPAPLVWLNQDRWDIDEDGPALPPANAGKSKTIHEIYAEYGLEIVP